MKVERLAVDTSVWIAALISPDGTVHQLVSAVASPPYRVAHRDLADGFRQAVRFLSSCGTNVIVPRGAMVSS
jgi:hypothetical protein